jgi:hypothetical protein
LVKRENEKEIKISDEEIKSSQSNKKERKYADFKKKFNPAYGIESKIQLC